MVKYGCNNDGGQDEEGGHGENKYMYDHDDKKKYFCSKTTADMQDEMTLFGRKVSEEKLAIFFNLPHQFENDRFTEMVKGYLNRDPDLDKDTEEEKSITLNDIINKCRVETIPTKVIVASTLDMKLHD
jgi:hypothetical protein